VSISDHTCDILDNGRLLCSNLGFGVPVHWVVMLLADEMWTLNVWREILEGFLKYFSVCILNGKWQAGCLDDCWMNVVEIQCKHYVTAGSCHPTAGNDSTAVGQTCDVTVTLVPVNAGFWNVQLFFINVQQSSPNVPSTWLILLCPHPHTSWQNLPHSASSILTVCIITVFCVQKALIDQLNCTVFMFVTRISRYV
jgi:hypothetical protein